jgi:hypothetical protein
MDMISGRSRISVKDPTSRFGNIELECSFEVHIRSKEAFANFRFNGVPMDELICTRSGGPVDIEKLQDTCNEAVLNAYIKQKKAVETKNRKYFVSPKYAQIRLDEAAAANYAE